MAACDASPSEEELEERPLSSLTTVQRRLSVTDASMNREDKRMLVSTSIVQPGTMGKGT
jgi:hypothetical protein